MSSIGASKLKLHVSTTFPETRTATTLRQLSSHLSQISPLLTLYTCIFLSSVSGESSLISSLPRRENVSNFHLYLCDETKKKERKKKENDILSQVPVKNREEETNQKPLIRFINRNIECTRWGWEKREGKRKIGVKRGMREGEKVIDRHLGRISRWRWFTGGEEIREKWKELK